MIRSGRAAFHPALKPLLVPIDSVTPAPYNYNNGDVEMIAESILKYGMWRPIQCQQSTGFITMGNHTWMACKELGSEVIPLVPLDMDDATAKAAMIEDNEIARKAMPDRGLMLELLDTVKDETGDYLLSVNDRDVEVLRALQEMPLESPDFAQWPTFMVQVHPRVLRAFRHMTREADDDAERLELLLRLAGWEG